MARFFRGQTRQLANLKISLLGLLLATLSSYANGQTLYERPVLIVDPGMHTARSDAAAVDACGPLPSHGFRGQDRADLVGV